MKSTRDRSGDHRLTDDSAPDGGSSLGGSIDPLGLAFRHKGLLLAGLAVGLLLGQAAYVKMGPSYLATTRVLVSKRNTAPLKEGVEAASYGERGEHVALITSPLIVGEAVKKYKLDQLASLRGAKDPVEEILGTLKCKRTAGSDRSFLNVLDITFESRTKGDAAAVVAAIANAYSDYLALTQKEYTAETVSLITKANNDLHKKLRDKEQAYIQFRETAPLHWRNAPGVAGQAGDTTNVHQERVMAIEADRRTNLLRYTAIHSKLKAIEQAESRGDSHEALEMLVRRFLTGDGVTAANQPTTAAGALLTTMETRLLPLILEQKKLLRDFGPDHPDVVAVQRSIEATREFYRQQGLTLPDPEANGGQGASQEPAVIAKVDLVTVYIASLKQEMFELEFRDRELTQLFTKESRAATSVSRFQLEDQTFNDEIKRLKTMWELIINRLNEISMLKDNGGYTLKTMAPPHEDLDLKRHLKITGIGGGLGLLLAFGVVALRSLLDTTLKTVDDVQRSLEPNVIGRVPNIDFKTVKKASRDSLLDPSLLYFHQPGSPEAEAYRSVRTALFVCTHNGGEKIIQVTSAEPQDGKTTLTCNLAVALAQSGKKVLLIDADLRCPKVFRMFGFRQEIGLSDVLAGEVELSTAVHATEVNGLSILGSGLTPVNPAEMLGGVRFQQMLRDVRGEFDFVLVDTPPLLAVSDPCIVAPFTDGLLFVVRLGKNRRAVARHAQHLLTTHQMNVLGVVVNGVPSVGAYGEGYAYSAYTDSKRKPESRSRPESEPEPAQV